MVRPKPDQPEHLLWPQCQLKCENTLSLLNVTKFSWKMHAALMIYIDLANLASKAIKSFVAIISPVICRSSYIHLPYYLAM